MKVAALLVLLAACGGDDGQVPFDAPPDLPVDTLPGQVAHGTVVAWQSPTTHGAGIAGARVCLRGAAHCVTTDATGAYALDGIPALSSFDVTVDAAGYVRTLIMQPASEGAALAIAPDAIAQQRVTVAGGTYPLLDKGVIEVQTQPATPSVMFSSSPAATAVYLGTDGLAQSGLTATSAEGGAMFVGLAAGDYSITGFGHTCTVPVESATLTYSAQYCPHGTL